MYPKSFEAHRHYNSQHYPDTVRIERGCVNGLTPSEVHLKEAAFALRAAGLSTSASFAENEGILDLACGEGHHARIMDGLLHQKIPIRGIDRSEEPISVANRMRGSLSQTSLHEFEVGDMAQIGPDAIGPDVRCKLITILGKSFIYGNVRETRQMLEGFAGALQPSGKLVLQSREVSKVETGRLLHMVEEGRRKLQMSMESFITPAGQGTMLFRDKSRGDAFYNEAVDLESAPDEQRPEEYREEEAISDYGTTVKTWRHKGTGFRFYSFRRVYQNETEHELEPTVANSMLEVRHSDAAIQLLEEAGFANVHLKTATSDDDYVGAQPLTALVGEIAV